jgi:hypothetical protein
MLVASLNLPRMIYKSTYTVVNIRILGLIPSDQEQRVLLNNSILLCFVTCFCKRSFHPSCIHSQALLWEAATARGRRRANLDNRSSRSIAFSNHLSSNNSLGSYHSQQAMGQPLSSPSSLAIQVRDNNRAFKRLRSSRSLLAIHPKANRPSSRASNNRHNSSLSNLLRHRRYSSHNRRPLPLYVLSRPLPRSRNRFRARHPRQLHQFRVTSSRERSQT